MERLIEYIEEFRKEHKLGVKATRLLLEAWRRYNQFYYRHHENKALENCWLGLGYPSAYARGKGMFKPLKKPTPKCVEWFTLTAYGVEVFKKFSAGIKWKAEYSIPIFEREVI